MRTRAQLLSSALCLIVVCALEFIGAHPALAYSGCGGMNRYAHQTTVLKQWNGVYAQLYTWNPAVNSLTGDFSLSHVYLWWDNIHLHPTNPFVEVGFYRGQGCCPGNNTGVAEYYDAWGSVRDGYQERDKGVYPTQASWNSYEIVYDSFDGTNYYWDVLVNGNRIEQVINNDLQTTAQALVGGETVAHINNEIKTSAQPEVLLQAPSVAWTEWTPALMVSAQDAVTTCTDATFTWTNYHLYDNFYVQGYVTA